MSVNVFGQPLSSSKFNAPGRRGPAGRGFKLTLEGNFDIEKRRLCNLADPQDAADAVSLHSLKEKLFKEIQPVRDDSTKLKSEIHNSAKSLDEQNRANTRKIDQLRSEFIELKSAHEASVLTLVDYTQENHEKIESLEKEIKILYHMISAEDNRKDNTLANKTL